MKKIISSFLLISAIILSTNSNAQHLVLVEEFTNASCFPCSLSEPAFDATLKANEGKVVSLRYHTNFPGYDPMYSHNAGENQSRVIYYQVTSTPQQRFEGKGLFLSEVTQSAIDDAYALPATVDVKTSYRISAKSDSIYARVVVKATSTITGNLVTQIAVVEKTISFATAPGSNGQKSFTNVMKKMLPDNGGTSLPSVMNAGDSVVINVSWALANVYFINQLAVVAFVQDNDSKTVIGTAYAPTPSTTSPPVSPTVSLVSKTNPVCSNNGSINVNVSGGTAPYQYKWSNGATTQNIAGLAAGNYIVTVSGGGANTITSYSLSQEQIAKPSSLTVTDLTSCAATLNWAAVREASYYQVAYRLTGSDVWSDPVYAGTNLSYTFSSLVPLTDYEFSVSSHCVNGNTAGYSYLSAKTVRSISPRSVSVTPTKKSASVSWAESCYSNMYWLEYRLMGTESWTRIRTRKANTVIYNLFPGTTYEYRIKNISGESNVSPWTNVARFTTTVTKRMEDNGETTFADNSIVVFPNPSNGVLKVKAALNIPSATATIQVTNVLGQVVYLQQLDSPDGLIDASLQLPETVPNGVYTLNIISENNRTDLRFVLNK